MTVVTVVTVFFFFSRKKKKESKSKERGYIKKELASKTVITVT
jgi:hypothetical protein